MTTKNLIDGELLVTSDNLEASKLRDNILEGIQDFISGKTQLFSGDLRLDLKKCASLKSKD